MPTKTSDLLAVAAPSAVAVVRGVSDDQLDLPTPCSDYAVRDLLNHLYAVVVNFQALAAKRQPEWAEKPDHLTEGWRDRFEAEAAKLVEAWSDPAALDGVSPGMGLPQETVGTMVLLDLTVHAWDLAVATGQPFRPAPEVLPPLYALTEQMGPMARERGVFAAPVRTSSSDAPEMDRLLALTGRDPGWSAVG
ncbi:TIGR03086 family protein [Micromonospora sp. C31]|uniref:TIGR03086 family metal-binding protein n=1 Tax=Micromonospora sp. C31 TaxID=2824876 RepID=UPI001B388FFF|nr:TIGR03086 family metal-binding protein [Micromonospora sp. C31]MBQ1072517.1 TIGR03086 family protein [Micromonospora sp. C31]